MNILQIAKEAQLDYLEDVKDRLSRFNTDLKSSTIQISSKQINDDGYIENLSKDLPLVGRFLYYFSVISPVLILENFKSFKTEQSPNTKLARLNPNNHESLNLYVGSSNSIKKRFKEHCGKAHEKTYALKLSQWVKITSGDINFTYIEVSNTDQLTLQHLEDALWRKFKPLFGKSGANNKF